jgi:AcrR family transcriptional regulator
MATTRRTQADRTFAARASLVASAATVLSERGFARATTAAIAAQASVTTGALHYHFPTKESLFFAVLDEVTENTLSPFNALSDGGQPGKCQAAKLIDSLWTVYGSHQYWAVWEINMGLRSYPKSYKQLIAHRTRSTMKIRDAVLENLAISDRTTHALFQFLPFILSAIRGIFLETFMHSPESFLQDQLAMLAEMLRIALEESPRFEHTESTHARCSAQT